MPYITLNVNIEVGNEHYQVMFGIIKKNKTPVVATAEINFSFII